MNTQQAIESSRIASLQQILASGNVAALETFWQEIKQHGAPLIEGIEEDATHHRVTFLWQAREETDNVVIWGGPAGLEHPKENQMTRLLDTDLWYKTYQVRTDLRGIYTFSVNDPLTNQGIESSDFGTRFIPDPLNPAQFVEPKDEEHPGSQEIIFSILELPGAPAQPWIMPRADVPKGKVDAHRLHSQILGNERRIWIYTPAGYKKNSEPYGTLFLFDGWSYLDIIPTTLDNLVQAGKIPPLVAILIDNPNSESRNLELPCHQPFVDFLTQELMPWIHEHYHVTKNPAQAIVAGASYGGLAATFAGLRAPETFGNVLSQSGSFWWDKHPEENIQQERITQQFIESPRLPLRFSLEVGLKEDAGWIHMVTANRHFRDVLILKGYETDYAEFAGYHHFVSWRGSFADRLMALVGKEGEA